MEARTFSDRESNPAAAPVFERRLPVGAELVPGGVHFRVWAPKHREVAVVLENAEARSFPLQHEDDGYFGGFVPEAEAGSLYKFRLGTGGAFPDPASRFQPDGPHGPSQVIDPARFRWSDETWRGVPWPRQVIYEMHIGTFTPEGTWQAAEAQLPELADLGITVLEVMPVAEFPGRFGWGYDGVNLFAPTRLYGEPDDFKRFVDRAHALGIGVILDVVYNHLGPDGNYLRQFSDDYFSTRHTTEWGEAMNFDDSGSAAVREFFVANARYWIEEYHLDGLRIDATQHLFDCSEDHILGVIARQVRQSGRERTTYLVGENEPQEARLMRPPEEGGLGLDALWNDDFHHSAIVALTGRTEAYYSDYRGTPQEFISSAKRGYLYQGQWYRWQNQRRGTPTTGVHPRRFVHFLQNHDQVANSLRGQRVHQLSHPGKLRALTALWLLSPATPLIFQGQEFAASAPFLYFADHHPELAALVNRGRRDFLEQFPSIGSPDSAQALAEPHAEETFRRCKLDFREREKHAEMYRLHRDLLRLRRDDPAFRDAVPGGVDGAVLDREAFLLRYFSPHGDRLLLVNLGADLDLAPAPEPLLAPPEGAAWKIKWSSEHPVYGGAGTPESFRDGSCHLPACSALLLLPVSENPTAPAASTPSHHA